ncbi:MAG: polysaccharide deacetylase family protein [candidate division Zixibacteria bacterium]|nr:polysaccharide deacetylase family protein [candidate division Zixibacteria bacterium]
MVIPGGDAPPAVPVLVYHNIDPRIEFSITRVSPTQFGRQMDFLAENGYRTATLAEVAEARRQRTLLPEKTVAIVFDDALEGVYDHALPVLVERSFVCTILPIVEYIGRLNTWDANIGWVRRPHMDWRQLAEASVSGMEIGSHTLRHPDLTALHDDMLCYELERSRFVLEDRIGCAVRALSCPFGRCSSRVVDRAFAAGYTVVSVIRGKTVFAHSSGGYVLPGTGVYGTTSRRSFMRKVAGMVAPFWLRWIETGIGFCAGQTPRIKPPDTP